MVERLPRYHPGGRQGHQGRVCRKSLTRILTPVGERGKWDFPAIPDGRAEQQLPAAADPRNSRVPQRLRTYGGLSSWLLLQLRECLRSFRRCGCHPAVKSGSLCRHGKYLAPSDETNRGRSEAPTTELQSL